MDSEKPSLVFGRRHQPIADMRLQQGEAKAREMSFQSMGRQVSPAGKVRGSVVVRPEGVALSRALVRIPDA